MLTRLVAEGLRPPIDDFGIGYPRLEQLMHPFTEISLTAACQSRAAIRRPAILESSMAMAQKLSLSTVAEGVETEEELALMCGMGCGSIQGYSRPCVRCRWSADPVAAGAAGRGLSARFSARGRSPSRRAWITAIA